jgi:hypothetical protein
MVDRELLKLAAKAAGIEIDPIDAAHEPENWCNWNPLEDDGDALRLAVKLSINIQHETLTDSPFYETVNCGLYGENSPEWCEEIKGKDPYAATRRAIVRAAAEIGETS